MQLIKNKKIWIFLLLTSFFSFLSFTGRNILVSKFNNADFTFFTIDHIKNYGAAFSLFHTHTSLLIVLSMLILLAVLFYIIKNISSFSMIELFFCSLLTAGINCNLFERLSDGFVTDYIRLNFIAFPIFNISDVFINLGAFILICNILFSNEKETD